MPGANSPLPPLPDAVSQDAVEATEAAYPSSEVKQALLDIASDLLAIQAQTTILGSPSAEPFSPSLQTLYIRLESGCLAPSPLQDHHNEEERVKDKMHKRTAKSPMHRPLEDFEDLYYAISAQIRNMCELLGTRVSSGFNSPRMPLFAGSDLTISSFHAWLLDQWGILNNASLAKALDNAIRRSRVKHLHQELLAQLQVGELTQADADELLADLYDPNEYEGVQGLSWIGGWSAAMIGAWLEEKYHVVFKLEKEEAAKKERWERKRKRMNKVAEQKRARGMQVAAERQHCEMAVDPHPQPEGGEQRPDQHMQSGSGHHEQYEAAIEAQRVERKRAREEQGQTQWQTKMQRVNQYSEWLRGMASTDARRLVHQTNYKVHHSFYASPGHDHGSYNAQYSLHTGTAKEQLSDDIQQGVYGHQKGGANNDGDTDMGDPEDETTEENV